VDPGGARAEVVAVTRLFSRLARPQTPWHGPHPKVNRVCGGDPADFRSAIDADLSMGTPLNSYRGPIASPKGDG
jgi:hypothetical protein